MYYIRYHYAMVDTLYDRILWSSLVLVHHSKPALAASLFSSDSELIRVA